MRLSFLRGGAIHVVLIVLAVMAALPIPAGELERWREGRAAEETETFDVVVVGGGISGLTAAYYLHKDYNVIVLEKNDRPGGRAVSGSYGGFTYSRGAEYIGKPYGALKRIVSELNIRPVEVPSPSDAVYQDGKFYFGEDGIALMYVERCGLGEYNRFVSTIKGLARGYDDIPYFDLKSDLAGLDDITAGKWFEREGFPEIIRERYNVFARGLFGANLDEVSALSMLPEIAFDYTGSAPIRGVKSLETTAQKGKYRTGVYTFTGGIADVTDALGKKLWSRIKYGSTVTGVSKEEGICAVTYRDDSGASRVVKGRVVILAVPAPVALRIAPDLIVGEKRRMVEDIEYSTYLTVSLISEEPIFEGAFDLAAADGLFFTDIYDATWVERYYDKSKRAKRDAEVHIAVVYVPPESFKDKSLLAMTDNEIIESVYTDLEKIFPGAGGKVVEHHIERFRYAFPVMTPGAYGRLTRLNELNGGTLLLAGDYLVYPTFESAVDSGFTAAERAAGELGR